MKRIIPKCILALLALLLVGAAGYLLRVNSHYGTKAASTADDSNALHIGAVNICRFHFLKDSHITAEFLLAAAKNNDIDVLVLQEFAEDRELPKDTFCELFRDDFPYQSIEDECAVLSRVPIISHERKAFLDRSDNYSAVRLLYDDQTIELLAVHLRTTGLYYVDYGKGINSKENAAKTYRLLHDNSKIRKAQAHSIQRIVGLSEGPVIVAGDFNALPCTAVYRAVKGHTLHDTFLEKGAGKGSTFRGMKDLPRIDYIFHNDAFECRQARIIDDAISDHRMITATLTLK